MVTLTWPHTRKKTQMVKTFNSFGQAWVFILTVRNTFKNHPFLLNGQKV